jgi:hypothetical protein
LELRRGTWFLAENYQPINPEIATKIEEHHLKHFRGQAVPDGQLFFEKDTSKKPSRLFHFHSLLFRKINVGNGVTHQNRRNGQ